MLAASEKGEKVTQTRDDLYTPAQEDEIVGLIVAHEAFMAVRHDGKLVADLMKRVTQKTMRWSQHDQ